MIESVPLLAISLLLIILTLACFYLALRGQRAIQHRSVLASLLHPLISAPLLIVTILWLFNIDHERYQLANEPFYFLLQTATVALAIPLHQHFHHIKQQIKPIFITLVFGASFASASAVIIGWLCNGSVSTLLSLSAKSITTPIALGVAQQIGALPSLAAGIVAVTGVVGAIIGPWLFHRLRVTDERIIGFITGMCAHGVGTARAFEKSKKCGAFSSLGLGLTGAITALVLPWVVELCS